MRQTTLSTTNTHSINPQSSQKNYHVLVIPILSLLKDCYLLWHNFLPHVPRLSRYTLGIKIDELFIELLEITFMAKYSKRENKLTFLEELNQKLDNLKFFVTLLWEAKGMVANV